MNRYIIDKRIGIVTVIDTQHPEYIKNIATQPGIQFDDPWIIAYWDGYRDPKKGWMISPWKIERAEYLCEILNRQN